MTFRLFPSHWYLIIMIIITHVSWAHVPEFYSDKCLEAELLPGRGHVTSSLLFFVKFLSKTVAHFLFFSIGWIPISSCFFPILYQSNSCEVLSVVFLIITDTEHLFIACVSHIVFLFHEHTTVYKPCQFLFWSCLSNILITD